MIDKIIRLATSNRGPVLGLMLLVALAGGWASVTTPLDAIPDLSDVQVIIYTEYSGQAPQLVEDQVTYPLTTAMLAVPKAKVVRGYSYFGKSFVYIIFQDGTDMYWARSRVLEYLSGLAGKLPAGVAPTLGPDATGVGWIYEYALVDRTGRHDLSQLRSIQDWYMRYSLQTLPGVSEVAAIGGYVKQYQVEVDPNALQAFGLSLSQVRSAISRSNRDSGGGVIEMAETEYMVRGLGYIRSVEDLNVIPVGVAKQGTPVRLQDVAHVHLGPEMRRGVAELDGEGEVAGGVVIMRFGDNAMETILVVREKLEELKAGLPPGVELVTTYDRGNLIQRAVRNLWLKLFEESVVVGLICMVFLLHARSALVAIVSLPVGILMAFLVMRVQGINANIMSLGGIAIAIGAMVDGAIVMIENAHKRLEEAQGAKAEAQGANAAAQREWDGIQLSVAERWQVITRAATEVGPALFFSLLIITVSFLPVFSLQAQEGRLFSPLAYTKTYAMAASAILAVTLTPVLMGLFITGRIRPEKENPINRWLTRVHTPWLARAMARPRLTLGLAALLLVLTLVPLLRTGSEFMPPLDEGDILYMPTTFPGISIAKAKEILQQTDKILSRFPEVERVFGKVGGAESATDPAMMSMIETIIRLKPKDQWPDRGKTTARLVEEFDAAIGFPGVANTWTMPIKTRLDMLSTGIKTPVGVKLTGPDLGRLDELSQQVENVLRGFPGTQSVFGERAAGGNYLDIRVDRVMAARYGLTVGDVQDVISTAIGGMTITQTVEGLERYPVNLRYPRELRDSPEAVARVLVPTRMGRHIPLGMVAEISLQSGPPGIKSEGGRPNAWVYVGLNTSDIGGYVAAARKEIAAKVSLPPGYTLTWSGQFEYMERAAKRLRVVVPFTLLLIFGLLFLNFRNFAAPLVVMASIPFAVAGGFWLVYLAGYNLSVAVGVGFIALAGVSAEIGVLVITFIDHELSARRKDKTLKAGRGGAPERLSEGEIMGAVEAGTAERVRPIAMTAAAILVGLLPIMWGGGTGSEVMRRIAAPMVGGMITATLLCLVVLPVLYGRVLVWLEGQKPPQN